MRTFLKSALVAASLTMAAGSAQAANIVQLAQTTTSEHVFNLTNAGGSYTLSTVGSKSFTATLAGFGSFSNSILTFSATGNSNAVTAGSLFSQSLASGSLTLISGGTNLLSFNFSGGELFGQLGGNAPTLSVSIPGNVFSNVTSDLFDFTELDLTGFSISMSDASPNISLTGGRLSNFTAAGTGTFSADDNGGPGGVPEPGTWAMMLAGFGLVGLARRRSNRPATVAA